MVLPRFFFRFLLGVLAEEERRSTAASALAADGGAGTTPSRGGNSVLPTTEVKLVDQTARTAQALSRCGAAEDMPPVAKPAAAVNANNRVKKPQQKAGEGKNTVNDLTSGHAKSPPKPPPKPSDPNSPLNQFARLMRQEDVRYYYEQQSTQIFVACLIMGNFVSNIVEKQTDPFSDEGEMFPACGLETKTFDCPWFVIETIWNVIFILELTWNMWGHMAVTQWSGSTTKKGPDNFFNSGWNLFDFVVVACSLPLMTGKTLPGLGMLRMLRAFRVFRLFKRVKSLNKIIVALVRAIPGILNSMLYTRPRPPHARTRRTRTRHARTPRAHAMRTRTMRGVASVRKRSVPPARAIGASHLWHATPTPWRCTSDDADAPPRPSLHPRSLAPDPWPQPPQPPQLP